MKQPDDKQIINQLLQEIARLNLQVATMAAMLSPTPTIPEVEPDEEGANVGS